MLEYNVFMWLSTGSGGGGCYEDRIEVSVPIKEGVIAYTS
jgi:hypothetical protein